MGINYTPKTVTNGLVFCVDAANTLSYPGAGTTWNDLSGNNNNGTLTNGPTFNSANKGSIAFDGTNDFVSVADNALLNQTTNLSINCWVYFNSGSIDSRIIFLGKGDGLSYSTTQYWLEKSSTNNIIFYCGISGNYNLNSNISVVANTWYNIVGTYNGTTMRVYVNGVLGNSLSRTGSVSTTNVILGIGKLGSYGGLRLNGLISYVSFYNITLSATEILQNYNAIKGRFNL